MLQFRLPTKEGLKDGAQQNSDIQIKKSSFKMVDKIKTQKCKYFNYGFCKFQNDCRFSHNENICTVIKTPKGRYREQCRRKTTCLNRHDENKLAEYEKLQS